MRCGHAIAFRTHAAVVAGVDSRAHANTHSPLRSYFFSATDFEGYNAHGDVGDHRPPDPVTHPHTTCTPTESMLDRP